MSFPGIFSIAARRINLNFNIVQSSELAPSPHVVATLPIELFVKLIAAAFRLLPFRPSAMERKVKNPRPYAAVQMPEAQTRRGAPTRRLGDSILSSRCFNPSDQFGFDLFDRRQTPLKLFRQGPSQSPFRDAHRLPPIQT
jgi:hypothetical protein